MRIRLRGWFGELNDAGVLRPHAALGRYSLIEKEFDERPGNYSGKSGEYSFLWNDLNGNGRMEWDELAFDRGEFSVLEWNSRFGDGLEFYFLRNRREICKLSPVWRDGLPRYD